MAWSDLFSADVLVPALTFALAALATLYVMNRRVLARKKREEEAAAQATAADGDRPRTFEQLAPALAAQIPMSQETRGELQKELLAAGFYRPTALPVYGGIRTILTLTPLIAAGVLCLFVDETQILTVLIVGAIAAGLGFSLPRVYLLLKRRTRAAQLEKGLPPAVDMMTMCLSSGLNVNGAFSRVTQELHYSHPVLAREFDIVRQQAELGSMGQALNQMAERVQLPEARNLATILGQSDRLGTDVSASLLEYSANLRTTMRQQADSKANRRMFWMLIPTLVCLWIPAVIVLVGPAVLELRESGQRSMQDLGVSRSRIQELQQGRGPAGVTPPGAATTP